MIIIFNRHDKNSWQWVRDHGDPEDTFLNWYDYEEQAAWRASGGTDRISAFPSVIVEGPPGNVIVCLPTDRAECERIAALEDLSNEQKATLIVEA